jgi:tetratricopeptide (TPR) repeat protein
VRLSGPEAFTQQCQSCHGKGHQPQCGASLAQQQALKGDCIACHMPAGGTSDIPHVRFHDHKIRIPDAQALPPAAFELHCATCAQPNASAHAEALLRYFEEQDADSALLRQARQLSPPQDAKSWAKIHYYAGEYLQALSQQEQALAEAPGDAFLMFFKGQILEALQRHEEAYAAYRIVAERLPGNPDAAIKAGSSLLRARAGAPSALAEAERYFRQASQAQPLDPQAWANLGFVSLNSRRWQDAEQQLLRALALDPDHPQALENMAHFCLAQLRQEEARRYAERLAAASPQYPGLGRLRAAMP